MGTVFPLLTCLERIANHFAAKNAQYCSILHTQSPFFPGVGGHTSGRPQREARCLDTDTKFRLARHAAFPLFQFYRTTAAEVRGPATPLGLTLR